MNWIVLDLTPDVSRSPEYITDLASHRAVGITLLGNGGRSYRSKLMEAGSSPDSPGLNK